MRVAQEQSEEAASLERVMRSILRMFAEGNLVYRRREAVVATPTSVDESAERVRRLRGARR